jgi:flavin-binding protein dodecin
MSPGGANERRQARRARSPAAANQCSSPTHRRESKMPEPTYKIVEIVGASDVSISKAIEGAIAKASESLRHLGWFEVGQIRGNIADGKIKHYQVTLKVGFTLE